MKVLIAGGAGYIGSTIASACSDAGITPVILDNLVTGRREFAAGRELYEGDIADGPLVDRLFTEHQDIDAVLHCAALIVVPDSVADPVGYYQANVAKSLEFAAQHVWDLAAARVAALNRFDALLSPAGTSTVINLGTGPGTTVRELLDAFNRVVSEPIRAQNAARRPGDVAGAYSRIDRARQLLDWHPRYGIAEGIRHFLQWASMRDEMLSCRTAQPSTSSGGGADLVSALQSRAMALAYRSARSEAEAPRPSRVPMMSAWTDGLPVSTCSHRTRTFDHSEA